MRIGQGYDVHAFGEGDHIIIGGVTIPYEKGLVAHSDGDVLMHYWVPPPSAILVSTFLTRTHATVAQTVVSYYVKWSRSLIIKVIA